jgi:peptide methionine sulfoxide reductase MsrA
VRRSRSSSRRDAAHCRGLSRRSRPPALKQPIVTQIVAAGPFYLAEEYHQKYHAKNPARCNAIPLELRATSG